MVPNAPAELQFPVVSFLGTDLVLLIINNCIEAVSVSVWVSLVMWFPGSFPFTSYPNFMNINQCMLRVRLITSEPNLRSCLMDEGLTGVCGA